MRLVEECGGGFTGDKERIKLFDVNVGDGTEDNNSGDLLGMGGEISKIGWGKCLFFSISAAWGEKNDSVVWSDKFEEEEDKPSSPSTTDTDVTTLQVRLYEKL